MKKIMAVLLSILLLVNAVPFSVFAENEEAAPPVENETYFTKFTASRDYLSERVNITEFRNYLISEISQCRKTIDISQFALDSSEETGEHLYNYIFQGFPEFFHVVSLSLYDYYVGSTFNRITVKYDYIGSDQYQAMMKECNEVADRLLEGLRGNDALSDLEKALIAHDRLALHLTYDYDHIYNNRDFYEAFVKGTAVCRGYTKAYAYLLNELGIPNDECSSRKLNHSWNIVYIDGESYHVDVTWDDDDRTSRQHVSHNNFLRSTQGMIESGHGDRYDTVETIDYDNTPTSTKYDSAEWQESIAAFQLINDELYYMNAVESALCKWDATAPEVLHKYDSYVFGGGFDSACNSLLFSKHDGVYVYRLGDGSVAPVYQPALPEMDWIVGFAYEDGMLNCKLESSDEILSTPYEPSEQDHLFDFEKDGTCTLCGAEHKTHLYNGECDALCNLCGEEREAPDHTYDNACDDACNVCGEVREVIHDFSAQGNDDVAHFAKCAVCGVQNEATRENHVYVNACDKDCNVCGAIRTPADHVYDNACDADCNVCTLARIPADHVYDNACDADCNVCGAERTPAEHVYDNACDGDCNVCGATRTPADHVYDHACDKDCNTCGAERVPADHVYDDEEEPICRICGFVPYTHGDLDGNGDVSSADAIYLLYYTLFGEARYPVNQPVDYDKDGATSSADAIYLLYYTLFGETRYPL